jgi:hypothetical protein
MDGRIELSIWGWDERWSSELAALGIPDPIPGRVVAQHRGLWLVVTAQGEAQAAPTGRFRHRADEGELPAVGDVRQAGAESVARKAYRESNLDY